MAKEEQEGQSDDKKAPDEQDQAEDPDEIEDEEYNMSLSEVVRFLVFSVIYVIIILNQISTENSYHISVGVSQALSSCDPTSVSNSKDVITWIGSQFLNTISNNNIYENWNTSYTEGDEYLRLNVMNRIITPLRFVQKRMTREENTNKRTNNIVKKKWKKNSLKPYLDNGSDEDKSSFLPAHLNYTGIEYDTQKYSMYYYDSSIGVSSSGGFMYEIDLKNSSEISSSIDFFQNTPWIDNTTAVIYVDFVLFNSHYSMLTYVNFLFTFYSSGLVEGSSEIRSSYFSKYTAEDTLRIILEAIYLLFLLFYTIIELQELKIEILSEKVKLEAESADKKYIKFRMVINGLKKHFADLWNILDVTSLILSYVSMIFWIRIADNTIIKRSTIEYSTSITDDVLNIIFDSTIYIRLSSVNLLIIFFRILKYMGKFERIRLLHQTFVRAKTEIFYFFILLIGIFLSFVIFGHVAFGGIHKQFSEIGLAFASCLIILFTNMETVQELLILDFNMTALFIVLFTLFINFILANMFIAIINNAYGMELERLDESKNKHKGEPGLHWSFQLKDWAKRMYLSFLSVFSKRKELINKYAEREREIANLDEEDEIIRAKNYNLDYNEAMQWGQKFDKEILTDKEKSIKISQQTFNFSKRVWKAVIFIVFAIIYTVVVLNQMEIEKKYDLNLTVQSEIQNAQTPDGINLGSVGVYRDFASWLTDGYSKIFTLASTYNLLGNYLVGQSLSQNVTCPSQGSIRLTVRYLETKSNRFSLFRPINNIMRLSDFSPYHDNDPFISNEYTDNKIFPQPSCSFNHSSKYDGGFQDLGGYVFYFSQDPVAYKEQMSDLLSSSYFLNESTNSIVLDFVLYNGDLNYFTYAAYVAQTISGGEIYSTFYIWPMKLKMYFTPSDKARAFFEIMILLLFIYHIFVSVTTLKNKFKNYDDWSTRFNEILTTKQKQKRHEAKPEWMRKLSTVITSYEILDFTSYILTFVCIVYWLMYISSPISNDFELPTDDPKFHEKFSSQAEILQIYLDLSSFNIILIYFRIMNYVTINKALSFLQDTMSLAMVDILYFLLMLVVILMGFVFLSYLSFGHTLEHYKTIKDSFITCFAMMIGEFDYSELLTADKSMAYFFFFIYMLFFTFILLNIFIAILERAYTKVKADVDIEETNKTVFESLLIFLTSNIRKLLTRKSHQQDHQKDIKELAICVFNRIESGLDDDEDPVSWATKQTEEILLERQKRAEIKAPLNSIFRIRKQNVIEGGNFFFEKNDDIIREFETRIDYWDYLRIGFLSFQAQDQRIRLKTEEMVKRNETKFLEFKEIEAAKLDLMADIQPNEVLLMKLKKENEDLREKIRKLDE